LASGTIVECAELQQIEKTIQSQSVKKSVFLNMRFRFSTVYTNQPRCIALSTGVQRFAYSEVLLRK